MKILYHHRTLAKDGQDVHITELIAAFRRQGHEVLVVGPAADHEAISAGLLSGLRKRLPPAVSEPMELAYSALDYRRLREAYLRFRPDFLYERYNLFLLSGLWLKRRYGVKLLLEVNAPLAHERAEYGRLAWRGAADRLEGMVWREADRVLPVTDALADFVRRAGAPESRIEVIQNGVNRAEFSLRPSEREAMRARLGLANSTVLGFIGFLRPWHGLRSAVDLVADLGGAQDVKLLVIGDGPARADLEAHARTRGVAHLVKVLGVAPRAEVPALLSAADIALQPNVTPYASPLKLFEYMALGRAIVAPDQPNIREIVSDGAEALLFDPGEPRSLYAAVERLCRDVGLRERLGAAASAAIERRGFLWESNAQRVVALAQDAPSELPAAAA
jgi:glycosyltransferase involved in cell wall biosynthesis